MRSAYGESLVAFEEALRALEHLPRVVARPRPRPSISGSSLGLSSLLWDSTTASSTTCGSRDSRAGARRPTAAGARPRRHGRAAPQRWRPSARPRGQPAGPRHRRRARRSGSPDRVEIPVGAGALCRGRSPAGHVDLPRDGPGARGPRAARGAPARDPALDPGALPGFFEAWPHAWLGLLLSHLGRFGQALEHAEHAMQIAERTNHPHTVIEAHGALGGVSLERGDLETARQVFERGVALLRAGRIGDSNLLSGLGYAMCSPGACPRGFRFSKRRYGAKRRSARWARARGPHESSGRSLSAGRPRPTRP